MDAQLSPNKHHSFVVPVDIPYRSPKKRRPTETPRLSSEESSYSAKYVPRRFNCFVKLDRLPDPSRNNKKSQRSEEMATETMDSVVVVPKETNIAVVPKPMKVRFKIQSQGNAVSKNQSNIRDNVASQIDRRLRTESTESIVEINVEHSLSMPTIDTPPPEETKEFEYNQPIVEFSNTFIEDTNPTISTLPSVPETTNKSAVVEKELNPPMVQLSCSLEDQEHILEKPPKKIKVMPMLLPITKTEIKTATPSPVKVPVVEEPCQSQPSSPPRPIIKLRNIHELLDSRPKTQLLLTDRLLGSFVGQPSGVEAHAPQQIHRQPVGNQMVPRLSPQIVPTMSPHLPTYEQAQLQNRGPPNVAVAQQQQMPLNYNTPQHSPQEVLFTRRSEQVQQTGTHVIRSDPIPTTIYASQNQVQPQLQVQSNQANGHPQPRYQPMATNLSLMMDSATKYTQPAQQTLPPAKPPAKKRQPAKRVKKIAPLPSLTIEPIDLPNVSPTFPSTQNESIQQHNIQQVQQLSYTNIQPSPQYLSFTPVNYGNYTMIQTWYPGGQNY